MPARGFDVLDEVRTGADGAGTTVLHDVRELRAAEPEVDGDADGANLAERGRNLGPGKRVERHVRHSITTLDADCGENTCSTVGALVVISIRNDLFAADQSRLIRVRGRVNGEYVWHFSVMLFGTEGGMVDVLLVEDDATIADLYALKLRLDGYAVAVAGDSASADQRFWQDRPHVVCLDEWLPGGTGTALAQRFAAAGAQCVLFTNDQGCYEKPPPGVRRSLLKARTNPSQLSAAISELVGQAPAPA